MNNTVKQFGFFAIAILAIALLGACNQSEAVQTAAAEQVVADKEPVPTDPTPTVEYSEDEVLAKLALADGLDGTVDKVVSKCASCALYMDGHSDHVVAHADYEMQFCSATCSESFAKDTPAMILALVIPEK